MPRPRMLARSSWRFPTTRQASETIFKSVTLLMGMASENAADHGCGISAENAGVFATKNGWLR